MNRVWKFTDLEYYTLWRSARDEGLPFPFYFATNIQSADVFRREMNQTREQLARTLGNSFDAVLETIVDPDLRIAVNGWDERAPRDPQTLVRLIGVRRGDRGCLVTQLPGESYWHAGGFVVTECDAITLADAVVDAMPQADAGGRSQILLTRRPQTDEMDYAFGRSAVQDSYDGSITDQAQQFLDAGLHSTGSIDVVQGRSMFGPRGITKFRLEWRDLDNDGRYAIDPENSMAVAIGRERLITMINTKVAAVVQAIKDERA